MRISLLILALPLFISAQAQTGFSSGGINDLQPGAFNHYHHLNDSSALQKKWSVSAWGGIGAGQTFFNGANTVFFPVAAGLQVNRRLNNNLYAFAGVETAPAFSTSTVHSVLLTSAKTICPCPGSMQMDWVYIQGYKPV